MLGAPAFGGAWLDLRNPIADSRIAAPETRNHIGPAHIRPVHVSDVGANRQRQPIVGVLYEYVRFRGGARRAGYPYFVMGRADRFDRVTTNRLGRPPRWRKTIPNRQGIYRAPQYGESGQVIQTS